MEKGYVHVYTGNGKGKTTAALCLSLRAVTAGKKVFFGQFIKGMDYSELRAPELLPGFVIEQFGRGCFIKSKPVPEDFVAARTGFEKVKRILAGGEYQVVVLDEIFIALYYELLDNDEVILAVRNRASNIEVIMTGRYAPEDFIDLADLVTEMNEVKNYYQRGVSARKGIEF